MPFFVIDYLDYIKLTVIQLLITETVPILNHSEVQGLLLTI